MLLFQDYLKAKSGSSIFYHIQKESNTVIALIFVECWADELLQTDQIFLIILINENDVKHLTCFCDDIIIRDVFIVSNCLKHIISEM